MFRLWTEHNLSVAVVGGRHNLVTGAATRGAVRHFHQQIRVCYINLSHCICKKKKQKHSSLSTIVSISANRLLMKMPIPGSSSLKRETKEQKKKKKIKQQQLYCNFRKHVTGNMWPDCTCVRWFLLSSLLPWAVREELNIMRLNVLALGRCGCMYVCICVFATLTVNLF